MGPRRVEKVVGDGRPGEQLEGSEGQLECGLQGLGFQWLVRLRWWGSKFTSAVAGLFSVITGPRRIRRAVRASSNLVERDARAQLPVAGKKQTIIIIIVIVVIIIVIVVITIGIITHHRRHRRDYHHRHRHHCPRHHHR